MADVQDWQSFIDDADAQAMAWLTWSSGRPVIDPNATIPQAQAQIAGASAGSLIRTGPAGAQVVYAGTAPPTDSVFGQSGIGIGILAIGVLLVIVILK